MQILSKADGGSKPGNRKERIYLFLLALPFIALVFMFCYLPLFGWIYAFFDYKPGIPLGRTAFVGISKFIEMFRNSSDIMRVLKNTMVISFLGIACSPLPVLLAVMITEAGGKTFKKIVQTVTTLPNFISWVIIFSLAFTMFSSEGLVNQILMGWGLISEPLRFLNNEAAVWPFQTCLLIWKTIGWNAIIYMAAIAGIDTELYDAAKVDGAGRFRCIAHILLPGISETYVVLLLLSVGWILNAGSGMEQFLVFYNPMVADKIEVLDLYVYRLGLVVNDYALATAVGILKTFVSVLLLFTVNTVSKKVRGQSIL